MADGFYVDVSAENNGYAFYYNIGKLISTGVKDAVRKVIGEKNESLLDKSGFGDYARMAIYNPETGTIDENELHFQMQGITHKVNRELAEEILILSNYYCPKDTGYLASTGRIEELPDGSCRIYYDCGYAWYVHEFSWRKHDYPTCDHFLTRAIYEVEKAHGFGWA